MSTVDYDIAESVTEIVGDFGNGPEAAITISGHSNRTITPDKGAGSFISCLTVSGGVVTEQWRKNLEFFNEGGSSRAIAMAYDNGRLFFVSFNDLLHGSLIVEVNPSTGVFGFETLISDLRPVDLIIDGTNLILGGRGLSSDELGAAKIPIPAVTANDFNPLNITIRSYSNTVTQQTWGGVYNVTSYIKTPQSIVPSANGGYMFIGEYAPNLITTNSFNDIGLVFNKIDDNLITTCMAGNSYSSRLYSFPFGYINNADTTSLTTSLGIDTISCDSLIATCYQLGCVTSNGIQGFNFIKCSEDTIALVGDFSEIGDFSYQWSPTAYLSGATILAPTTTTPRSQTYSLTITDNTTGCQVAVASYSVAVELDTIKRSSSVDKCPLDAIVLENNYSAFNTGVFTYQWSPTTHLNGQNILEPTIHSIILPVEYTLVATEEGGCSVHEIKYTISASGGLVDEHRINCLSSDPSFYVTTDPGYLKYKMNLNVVLANLGIFDTTGVWVNPTSNYIPLTPPSFDPATSILVAGIAANLGTLYYSYGDTTICQNGLILHFGPDASIDGASIIDVCDGAELTFNTSNVDPSIEHQWVIHGHGQAQSTVIHVIPFGDSLSITSIFNYNPAYEYYKVVHHTASKNCPNFGFSTTTSSVKVYVHPGDGTITTDACTGALILPTNTANDIIQWYNATTGLAITGETTHTYSPATSGSYYASVTTSQCDFISDTFNYSPLPISSIATVNSNYNGADISCFGASDGVATVTISNGLSPYTYLWSNGDVSATASNLAIGNYQVTVIDACMDTAITSVILTEPTALVLTINTLNNVSCAGLNDGSANLTISGGTAPYTYLWSDAQTGATATGLAAGVYTVTVTDNNACTVSSTVSITEPIVLNTVLTNTNLISCAGGSDGAITATTTGGTLPYTYLWSDAQTGVIATGLVAGVYTVTVTDDNACTVIKTISIIEPIVLNTVLTNTNLISCAGASDGGITSTTTGGAAPYTYLWSDTQTGATATGLVAGVHSVTVTDNNACTVSSNATITEPTVLSTTLDSTNVNCITTNSGVIDNTPTGGTLPYTYLWSNGATSQDVNGLVAGNYCVTITDANNCTIVACTNIEPLITPFSIVKLVDKDTIVPYDTVCYSILVTNNCQAPRDVAVTDTLPSNLLVTTVGSFTYDNITNVLSDTLTIAAGATDTLQFKARVLKTASCGNVDSIINQANAYELGSPTPIVSDVVTVWIQDTFATNCMPLPDTVYFSDLITTGQLLSSTAAQSTIQTVNVAGVWILDVGLSYSFTNGSILEMSPGAQIIVSDGANLTLNNATVRAACNNCLWQSILVQGDGTIATERTVLRDAQYAIHAENKAILQYIVKTDFLDNFIGIYAAPNVNNNNLIIGAFENNTFSAPSILPPYVGLQGTPTLDMNGSQVNVNPNATGGTGLSGILGWDIIALNLNLGTPALSNTFQRLVSGIVLFNTNFSTNSCSFNTIEQNTIYATSLAYQGCGIHIQSPIVLDFKEALVEDCSFENCFIGISGIGCGMRIYRNQMSEIVDMGVRSTRLFNTVVHVRFNNFSKMERFGVAAFDPRIPSDIWIDNNTMDMTTVPGEGACILISDNPTGDASSLVISNNTLSANEAQNGIAVLNHENSTDPRFSGLIQGNTITMEGNNPDRAGISGSNSRLHIECNTVTGDSLTLGAINTYGIVAAGGVLGGTSPYQCNTVTNTSTGVFFEGFNNQVTFRGNGFDRHRIGLLLDGGAVIGDQFDNQEYYGNTWTGRANSDVFHNGNVLIQQLSRFQVNSSFNPNFEPQNAGAFPAWFNNNTNFPNFDCVEPFNYCGNSRSSRSNRNNGRNNSTNTPSITGLDDALARNGLGNIPLVTRYNAKRALFRKLVNNPSLANNSLNPHIRNFVARHQNTCIGHFDVITTQCEQAFMMSSIDSILLDSCKSTCLIYLDSLHYLDSILANNFNAPTAITRNTVANNLSRVMQQQQVLLDNIQVQQQTGLTPICANNNSFSTTVLHEVLEKEVNDIYLNTLAKGILEFNSNELFSLRRTAAHCPQEGGAAVHQARGMLSMVEDVNLLNFDCTPNNGRSSIIEEENESKETNSIEKWDLILYPNPTNNRITLESNLVLEDEIQIEIYNSLGQKVKKISINEDMNTIDINVSSFLDGIYNVRLQSGAYKITKSFVVVK